MFFICYMVIKRQKFSTLFLNDKLVLFWLILNFNNPKRDYHGAQRTKSEHKTQHEESHQSSAINGSLKPSRRAHFEEDRSWKRVLDQTWADLKVQGVQLESLSRQQIEPERMPETIRHWYGHLALWEGAIRFEERGALSWPTFLETAHSY